MARANSVDKRNAILDAATHVIAAQGLGAPTAAIAKHAGVSNGTLFAYFPTKAELLNQLFVELNAEMASAALDGLPKAVTPRSQMEYMWKGWLRWAAHDPDKRRSLAHLSVSDEITQTSRECAHRAMADVAVFIDRFRRDGVLRDAPLGLVASLLNAVADATFDFVIRDPAYTEVHQKAGFDALWKMLT